MIRHVYDKAGTTLLRDEQAEPKCNVDFCDSCGDCLYCYGEDFCPGGAGHSWVVYEEAPHDIRSD